jgi:hypothetical protein
MQPTAEFRIATYFPVRELTTGERELRFAHYYSMRPKRVLLIRKHWDVVNRTKRIKPICHGC